MRRKYSEQIPTFIYFGIIASANDHIMEELNKQTVSEGKLYNIFGRKLICKRDVANR